MAEVASAFVSLLPSARGFGAATDSAIGPQVAASGRRGGLLLGKAMLAGFAAVGIAAAVGKTLYNIGSEFDDMNDTIRTSTGKTGTALAGLEESAKNVGKRVPVAFSQIGPVISDLNRRLGLTGKPLERLAAQFLDLGHITGTAIDTQAVTGALNVFNVKGDQASKVMNQLFRVTQSTGVGFNDLTGILRRQGAVLSQFGFSINQSASLIGTLDKAGIDSNRTLSTLSKAMATFAKAGEAPRKALLDTITQIQGFIAAGDKASAVNLAASIFGTRGATQFVAAVQSGRLNVDALTNATRGNHDTIVQATKDTADFSEQWQLFKNRVMVALEPIATRVFNAVGSAATAINAQFGPALARLSTQLSTGQGPLGEFATTLQTKLLPALRDSLPPVLAGIKSAFASLSSAIRENRPQLEELGRAIVKAIPIFAAFVGNNLKTFGVALRVLIGVIGNTVVAFNAIRSAVQAVGHVVSGAIADFQAFRKGVGTAVSNALDIIKSVPGKVKSAFSNAGSLLIAAGAAIIQGLINGVESKIGELTAKLRAITSLIPKVKGPPAKDALLLYGAGRLIMDGLGRGIEDGTKPVVDALGKATQAIKDKLTSTLADLKSQFSSIKDSVAQAFNGNLFGVTDIAAQFNDVSGIQTSAASTAAQNFISGLMGGNSQMKQLLAAFKTLKGWGLKSPFLAQLFQSGNAPLILELAADKGEAKQASQLFTQNTGLANQLGTAVAQDSIGKKIDTTNAKLDHLIQISQETAHGVNGTKSKAHKVKL